MGGASPVETAPGGSQIPPPDGAAIRPHFPAETGGTDKPSSWLDPPGGRLPPNEKEALSRLFSYSSVSSSAIQRAALASDGIRQSPRGDRAAEPTLGPSGTQLRLNCWEKNLR